MFFKGIMLYVCCPSVYLSIYVKVSVHHHTIDARSIKPAILLLMLELSNPKGMISYTQHFQILI